MGGDASAERMGHGGMINLAIPEARRYATGT